ERSTSAFPAPTRRQHEPHRDCRRPSSPRSRTAEPAAAHRTSGTDRPSPPLTVAARSERCPLVRSHLVWFHGKGDCAMQSLIGDKDHEGAIMFTGITATSSVGGEKTATDWYTRLLDRAPDARPMAGLVEWRLAE